MIDHTKPIKLILCTRCDHPNSLLTEECPECGYSIFKVFKNDPEYKSMIKRTLSQNNQLYGLLNGLDLMAYKDNLVETFTNGRTIKSSEMTFQECDQLLEYLKNQNPVVKLNSSNDKMRKKIIGICHDMGWRKQNSKIDLDRINQFLLMRGHVKKELNDLEHKDLVTTISQFESLRNYHLTTV